MKLLSKYNRVNLITTIIIMFITSLAYYQAISWVLTRQKDKDLEDEEMEIFEYVALNRHLPQTFETKHQQISFSEAKPNSLKREFIDTIFFKKWDKNNPKRYKYHALGEYEPGRGLISSVSVASKYYKILVIESKVETEDLLQIIFYITIGVIILLFVVLFATNRLILNRLWKPFYSLMQELKAFNIAEPMSIPKIDTSIDEFKDLNTVVADMTTKAKTDYVALKYFTENASHELLTPIAVINSKLDTLIQTDNFSERQSKLLSDLYTGVSRLNRLNQSLLLLVKIENRLLQDQQIINIRELTEEMIVQFEEIFNDKELKLTYELNEKEIYANRYLIEILISNLITNAIRHNYAGGEIAIHLTDENFVIQNTGDNAPLPLEKIFMRFHKSSGSEGSGLGLTISRQICENFNLVLNYRYASPYHNFVVTFPTQA
jgi:signal transduction histidine kinase